MEEKNKKMESPWKIVKTKPKKDNSVAFSY